MPASSASSSSREGSGSGGSQISSSASLPCTAPGLCRILHVDGTLAAPLEVYQCPRSEGTAHGKHKVHFKTRHTVAYSTVILSLDMHSCWSQANAYCDASGCQGVPPDCGVWGEGVICHVDAWGCQVQRRRAHCEAAAVKH